jgi:hypothetical protein
MFVLRLQAQPGVDAIKALRWLLKKARRLGLRAVKVTEETETSEEKSNERHNQI